MPEIGFTSRLYMPASKEYEEGKFVQLSWKFGKKYETSHKKEKSSAPDEKLKERLFLYKIKK